MSKEEKKEYWMCIVGSTVRSNLPAGCDAPMRRSVEKAYESTAGKEDDVCYSGWGLSERRKNLIMTLWCMEEENLPNKIECKKTPQIPEDDINKSTERNYCVKRDTFLAPADTIVADNLTLEEAMAKSIELTDNERDHGYNSYYVAQKS